MKKNLLLCLSLFCLLACAAAPRQVDPSDPASVDAAAQRLGAQLRCPVCRGVPISESPAGLAQEMMDVLRTELAKGKSDAEILRYFEERYGAWVLLQPKAEGMNLLIWILPAFLIVSGAVFIFVYAKKQREQV